MSNFYDAGYRDAFVKLSGTRWEQVFRESPEILGNAIKRVGKHPRNKDYESLHSMQDFMGGKDELNKYIPSAKKRVQEEFNNAPWEIKREYGAPRPSDAVHNAKYYMGIQNPMKLHGLSQRRSLQPATAEEIGFDREALKGAYTSNSAMDRKAIPGYLKQILGTKPNFPKG